MFVCSCCKRVTEPREKMFRRVTKVRRVTYRDRFRDTRVDGTETVQEEPFCSRCNLVVRDAPAMVR